MRKKKTTPRKPQFRTCIGKILFLLLMTFSFFLVGNTSWVSARESCIDCHSDPKFVVTNKKLFDYFKEWKLSIHAQEEVTCSDCHGGNPEASGKQAAHGGKGGVRKIQRAVNFINIPTTCGQCHDDILDSYRKSNHYKYLRARKQEKQGPNCVTCHGSLNSVALNVNTVKGTCLICHNQKTGNHPEIPQKAEWLLNKFLSMHRLFRYVTARGDAAETRDYVKKMNLRIETLSEDWHKFDLAAFEKAVTSNLDSLKKKRNEIRKRRKQQNK